MRISFWSNFYAPLFSFPLLLSPFQYHFVTPFSPPPPIQSFCIAVVFIFFRFHLTVVLPSLPTCPTLCFFLVHYFCIIFLYDCLFLDFPFSSSPPPPTFSWPLLSSLLHYITHFHALFHLHAQPTTVYLRSLARSASLSVLPPS